MAPYLRSAVSIKTGFPWKPHKGEWKVIKLPREAGKTEPMTREEYDRLHSKK